MTIRKKSKEELQKQAEGFLEYAEKNGKIGSNKAKEILDALGGKDADISDKEKVRQQLLGVLSSEEFEELYENFYDLYSTTFKDLRKYLENLKLFPDKYSFLIKNFLNTAKKNTSLFSLLREIQETSDDNINEIRKSIKSNIIFFENLSFDKNDIGKLDFNFLFAEDNIVEMKKIIEQLEARGINKGVDNFNKLVDIIVSSNANGIIENMKMLRDEFGIDGVDNFAKLAKIISEGYDSDKIEKNMKMLRDEFGIDGVDNFSKLTNLITDGNPDKTEKNMKKLRDEFGIDGADNFAKLTYIIKYGDPDKIERIMKKLRDEFGIDGADNFAKLTYIIEYRDPDKTEKNMKMLRDEFGIDGVDNFSKLAKIIREGYDSDKIKRIMKKLRDELGVDGVDNFSKLEDLITNSNYDQIERNMNIFRYEFGIYGVDDFFKWKYFIKNLKLPVPSDFKEGNHMGYLKFLNEIINTNYDSDKQCKMIEKVVTLTFEQAENYVEIFKMLDGSISMDIQRIKNELIDELLKTDNPKDIAQQIINIFERNNLPLTGKIFKVFELLYPKEKFKDTLQSHGSPVLHEYLNEGKKVYDLIYRDLMNIAIKSGDRSLRDYLNTFVGSQKLLKKFEDIVASEGFDGNDPLCLDKKLEEDEQAKLLYLFRRISVLYNRYYGREINEGNTIEDRRYGESTVADNQLVEFYNDIRKGFHLRKGESIYDRLQKFLLGLGYHSFSEVLENMEKSKEQAHERGLKLYNEAKNNGGKINFPKGAFLKGVENNAFPKIINRGVTCREYLGGGDDGKAAGSDATPFDIDGIYVDSPIKRTGYGNINLVVDTTKSSIYDTKKQLIEGYTEDKYELFETCGGSPAHYGIRTGMPMTEVDYIIYHGDFTKKEFEDICYEISRNGYYIPIADKDGDIKFTPEMYHNIRKGFNYMEYYDGFDVEQIDGKWVSKESDNEVNKEYTGINEKITDDGLRKLISDNSPSNEKYSVFAKENRELAENTIEWIKRILEDRCGIKFNSKHDTSITGAELHDSGSTGRGTDIPTKDVDLDFTLILDVKDYEKVDEISKIIHEEIGTKKDDDHGVIEGGNQIKSKINNIGKNEERPDGVPLDLLILKKTQVIDYSSSDAMKEKLDYIASNPETGVKDLDLVRTNVIIMKKLLKAKGCYKKPEGGISGIGVENWITQHHGSFIEALESFEQVAYGGEYGPGKQPKSLVEFQKSYPIYDAGENYKDGGNDNFVYKLEESGYKGTLEIIKALRTQGIGGIEKLIKEYEKNKKEHIG